MRPHRRQPTKLPRPWDSPGKNTGVGCHFLLQCMKVKVKSLGRVPLFCSLPGSSIHGIFQARVLEWGAIAFSRGIPTTHLKSNPLELYVGIFSFLSFIINFPIFLEIVFQNLNPLNITLYVPVVFCTHGFLISSIHQSMGFGYFQDSASLDLS